MEVFRLAHVCGIHLQELCVSSCLNNKCFTKMKGSDCNKDVLGCSFESVILHNFQFSATVPVKIICNTLRWEEINFVFPNLCQSEIWKLKDLILGF